MSIPSAISSGQNLSGHPQAPVSLRALPQTGIWREAMMLLGHPVRPLALLGLPGQATLHRMRGLGTVAVVARAPGFLDTEKARSLRRALGVGHLVVQPDRAEEIECLRRAGFRQIARPVLLVEIDLTRTPADMMGAMSVRWRARLTEAIARSPNVARAPLPADPRHWLLMQLATPAHQPGPMPLRPEEIAALCAVRSGAGQVITVRRKGALMATLLILRHGAAATCQISWVSELGRTSAAGHLALWQAMLELRHLGVHRLSLGLPRGWDKTRLAELWHGAGGETRVVGGHWLDSGWVPRRRHRPIAAAPLSLASGSTLALR